MSTFIRGKDASLEESLQHFEHIAASLKLRLRVCNELNPLPDVFSLHLEEETCPEVFYSNGKGATRLAALCSAYGEFYERLFTHMFFADYFLGEDNATDLFVHFTDEKSTSGAIRAFPKAFLTPELRAFYQEGGFVLRPDQLADINAGTLKQRMYGLPFVRHSDGQKVYFPVNILANLYVSNGMSAGNTKAEALVQAISEIIERYVKKQIIAQGMSMPQIPEDILQQYPASYRTWQKLQTDTLKVRCFDASLGGKFPVVCALVCNQENGTCGAAFGCHPVFEVALERTLTELLQGRTLKDFADLTEPQLDTDRCADPINLESHFIDSTGLLPLSMLLPDTQHPFRPWDFTGNTQEQFEYLSQIVSALGHEMYIRFYPACGLAVCQVIIPGMSEVYPVDELYYGNNNQGVELQKLLLCPGKARVKKLQLSDKMRTRLELPDEEPVSEAIGLLPDPDSVWKDMRIGELRCLWALICKDYEEALQQVQWVVAFEQSNPDFKRLKAYKAMALLLELKLRSADRNETDPHIKFMQHSPDIADVLTDLYGQEAIEFALCHLTGTYNLLQSEKLAGANLDFTRCCKKHQAMLKILDRVKLSTLDSFSVR